jgi:Histidine phosphatase superfamily (branch 2)
MPVPVPISPVPGPVVHSADRLQMPQLNTALAEAAACDNNNGAADPRSARFDDLTAAAAASNSGRSNSALSAGDSMHRPSTDHHHDHTKDILYLHETFELMLERWEKLRKDFYSQKTGKYDLTKVPDIYDMIRFDALHNSQLELDGMQELFELANIFENSVVPQEYGTDRDDKRRIGSKMCKALLEKIKHDLKVAMV